MTDAVAKVDLAVSEQVEETDLASMLVRLSHLVQHVFGDVSRGHDLTPQQAQLLCLLISGPVGMTELSRLLHLEKSSLTGLVDRVERRGLVERVRHPRDRRACSIALTEQGRKLGAESHAGVTRTLDELAAGLREADREVLMSSIRQILAVREPAPGG